MPPLPSPNTNTDTIISSSGTISTLGDISTGMPPSSLSSATATTTAQQPQQQQHQQQQHISAAAAAWVPWRMPVYLPAHATAADLLPYIARIWAVARALAPLPAAAASSFSSSTSSSSSSASTSSSSSSTSLLSDSSSSSSSSLPNTSSSASHRSLALARFLQPLVRTAMRALSRRGHAHLGVAVLLCHTAVLQAPSLPMPPSPSTSPPSSVSLSASLSSTLPSSSSSSFPSSDNFLLAEHECAAALLSSARHNSLLNPGGGDDDPSSFSSIFPSFNLALPPLSSSSSSTSLFHASSSSSSPLSLPLLSGALLAEASADLDTSSLTALIHNLCANAGSGAGGSGAGGFAGAGFGAGAATAGGFAGAATRTGSSSAVLSSSVTDHGNNAAEEAAGASGSVPSLGSISNSSSYSSGVDSAWRLLRRVLPRELCARAGIDAARDAGDADDDISEGSGGQTGSFIVGRSLFQLSLSSSSSVASPSFFMLFIFIFFDCPYSVPLFNSPPPRHHQQHPSRCRRPRRPHRLIVRCVSVCALSPRC